MTTWPKRDKDGRHVTSVDVEVECYRCQGKGVYYLHNWIASTDKQNCHECKGTGKVKCQ